MAKLFQSEWNEIKARRGVQDLDNLITLLDADGSIDIVDDPTEDEIRDAREQAAKLAQERQEQAEEEAETAAIAEEEAKQAAVEAFETSRAAAFPLPEDNPPPVIEETVEEEVVDEGKKGRGKRKKDAEEDTE